MRTLQQKLAEKALQPKAYRLSFKEFCQYVYEPTQRMKALNLPEDQKREIEEAIQERLRDPVSLLKRNWTGLRGSRSSPSCPVSHVK